MPRASVLVPSTHMVLWKSAWLGVELVAPRLALAEGLERGQPLDGVEELGAERGIGLRARQAAGRVAPVPEDGREQRDQRGDQHDQRDRQVDEGHDAEDEQRRQRDTKSCGRYWPK